VETGVVDSGLGAELQVCGGLWLSLGVAVARSSASLLIPSNSTIKRISFFRMYVIISLLMC